MISVLILTLNEEVNLEACLQSVRWSDDITVFDSYSSDRTLEIARDFGARVLQRRFDNERDHRTASLRLGFKHPWVFNPDADEIATPELIEEMQAVVADQSRPEVAYRMRGKTMFLGRWLKHSSLYPTWMCRLFQPQAVAFERSINLHYKIDGPEGRLNGHYLHYTFNKGLTAWIEKHNRYSLLEAEETLKSLRRGQMPWRDLFTLNPVRRRRALKELSFRLPCRPTLRFLYMYLLRRGFLDGRAGFTYCRLLALYEYLIAVKLKELQLREQGLPV
jgi:glycosyltransferase involved in cell wall biosynthesis